MVGNGTISYDHERDGRPTELGGCNAMVRNLKHDTFLFIRYVRRRLTVRSAGDAPREHHSLLIVSFDIASISKVWLISHSLRLLPFLYRSWSISTVSTNGGTAWTYRGCGYLRATTSAPRPSPETSRVKHSPIVSNRHCSNSCWWTSVKYNFISKNETLKSCQKWTWSTFKSNHGSEKCETETSQTLFFLILCTALISLHCFSDNQSAWGLHLSFFFKRVKRWLRGRSERDSSSHCISSFITTWMTCRKWKAIAFVIAFLTGTKCSP